LQVAVTEQVALVKISGRASFNCSVDFKTLVYELRDRGYRKFVLDLGECLIIDSTFLGILAGFGLKLAETPGEKATVTLLNPNPRILDLLDNLGVAHLFCVVQGKDPLSEKCRELRQKDGAPGKVETTRTCLEAHETLMNINPANVPKFKDVTKFMAEDLKRLEAQKSCSSRFVFDLFLVTSACLRSAAVYTRAPMFHLRSLNPQQRLAVETVQGPVLILAGAGTGKTRVITCRIAHMIGRGVAPESILGVTFTNKAAREMRERVHQLVPAGRSAEPGSRSDSDARPTLCTFHSLCVRILRQHIEKLGYKRNFVIYDESEQLAAIRKILSHISAKGEKTDPAAMLGLLSRCRNGDAKAAAFHDASVVAMAEHIRSRYESALRACNAVDFDDLILLTLRLFKEHPGALAACRGRYRYVMVDEYQDTNAAQFQLVRALTQEHQNICVVGDDDQSIYGWRGAEIANLLDMEKHFPGVKVIKLEQNYRSTNTILTAANAVIRNNARRRPKQLWSANGQGTRIALSAFANEEEEARTIVEEIEFLRQTRRIPWSDQAILFRTNQQSRPLETALRQAGVRYHLVGGQSFFDRREVKDLLAYLKVLLNPDDDMSLLRIANVPARGLSDVTMERVLAASQELKCSAFAAMKNPAVQVGFAARTRESIGAFVGLIERTQAQLADATVARGARVLQSWAQNLVGEIGYVEELRRSERDAEAAQNKVRNLQDLIASMDDVAAEGDDALARSATESLQTFLEELALDNDREDEKENTGDAVTLITMHSCKGLEFPHVYIVGLEDGLLPHSRSKLEGTLDEERRLFYVALTRAMQTLTLSHCAGRKKYGQIMPCHPSPFLKELPAELVEDADERAKAPVTTGTGKDLFAAMRSALG
jgi:superfamily I DNA/RNA helicase/anti-anti-sigma regulatory factor